MSNKTKKRKSVPGTKLDTYEQEIEDRLEPPKPHARRKTTSKIKAAKKAAEHFIRKDKRITIRVYSADLERIKRLALQEGLPYQTFITSVLHKLSTGTLYGSHSHTSYE